MKKIHNKQNITQSKLNISSLPNIRIFPETNGCYGLLKDLLFILKAYCMSIFSSSDSFQILEQNYFKCCGFMVGDKFAGENKSQF